MNKSYLAIIAVVGALLSGWLLLSVVNQPMKSRTTSVPTPPKTVQPSTYVPGNSKGTTKTSVFVPEYRTKFKVLVSK